MSLFSLIGIGVFIYGVIYTILTLISDCDLELLFYEKFGKSPRRLKGKVVFITGASSGIGEFTAYALAKHGVKLVLAARRGHELQRVKRNCIDFSKDQLKDNDILVIPMDVTQTEAHRKHFDYAVRHFGRVDILLNNAGRSQRAAFEDIELAVDKQMFELNVFSVLNLSRIALEHFEKVGGGHIAIMSSIAGFMGIPYSASYVGAKHALNGYFKGLRMEKLGTNIHVTIICPGPTFTNFLQESFTAKDGVKYNVEAQPSSKRMSAERCGYLTSVALVNKTKESWIAVFPLLVFCYIAAYFPVVFNCATKMLGPERLNKFRDSKEERKEN